MYRNIYAKIVHYFSTQFPSLFRHACRNGPLVPVFRLQRFSSFTSSFSLTFWPRRNDFMCRKKMKIIRHQVRAAVEGDRVLRHIRCAWAGIVVDENDIATKHAS